MKKKIDLEKKYNIPQNIGIQFHNNKRIIIAVDFANWIIADNDIQLDIFKDLRYHNIQEIIDKYPHNYEDVKWVITQIEARHFCKSKLKTYTTNNLQLYLTNECNLRCPHCFMHSGIKKNDELSYDEFIEIITQFASDGGEKIIFSGGEVMTYVKFDALLKYAKGKGLFVSIMTNGTLWNSSIIDKLSQYIDEIQISIDGYNEESNSKVRGINNFEKALNTVESFLKKKINTKIAVTPLFKNPEKEISEYIEWGKNLLNKYGSKNLQIIFNSELLPGRAIDLNSDINKKYPKYINEIYAGIYGIDMDAPFINAMLHNNIFDNCGYGNLSITSNGDIYLCGNITGTHSIGNIRTIEKNKLKEIREKAIKYSHVSNLIPCKDCDLKNICGGNCRIKYFKNFGNNDFDSSLTRICSKENKEAMLETLIRTNKSLFQP